MEAERREKMKQLQATRKALTDCTNINNSSQSSSSSSLISRLLKTKTKTKTDTKNPTTGSTRNHQNATTNPNSALSVPPVTPVAAANGDDAVDNICERSVYTRRRQSADKSNDKGKAVAEPLSYSPAVAAAARIPTVRNRMNEDDIGFSKLCTEPRKRKSVLYRDKVKEDLYISLSRSCILPHKKKQRTIPPTQDDSKYSLPQDFVQQQRAYFKQIDEFELPEEEVESGDELE
ncbi:hypothetical protein CFOL_v3_05992 [Cephalotus follicularis]|uniref:Sororin C-terminal region domain-containing protein n=1 Tax=Cephalotus follicularis TaxID=3775 RepID=A0A1Q3B3F0_CEPFO|nr:hypothetical protein CFOL_v3_05992 [Cephalotus follicularis]